MLSPVVITAAGGECGAPVGLRAIYVTPTSAELGGGVSRGASWLTYYLGNTNIGGVGCAGAPVGLRAVYVTPTSAELYLLLEPFLRAVSDTGAAFIF